MAARRVRFAAGRRVRNNGGRASVDGCVDRGRSSGGRAALASTFFGGERRFVVGRRGADVDAGRQPDSARGGHGRCGSGDAGVDVPGNDGAGAERRRAGDLGEGGARR